VLLHGLRSHGGEALVTSVVADCIFGDSKSIRVGALTGSTRPGDEGGFRVAKKTAVKLPAAKPEVGGQRKRARPYPPCGSGTASIIHPATPGADADTILMATKSATRDLTILL
jgi:hypothetical protein